MDKSLRVSRENKALSGSANSLFKDESVWSEQLSQFICSKTDEIRQFEIGYKNNFSKLFDFHKQCTKNNDNPDNNCNQPTIINSSKHETSSRKRQRNDINDHDDRQSSTNKNIQNRQNIENIENGQNNNSNENENENENQNKKNKNKDKNIKNINVSIENTSDILRPTKRRRKNNNSNNIEELNSIGIGKGNNYNNNNNNNDSSVRNILNQGKMNDGNININFKNIKYNNNEMSKLIEYYDKCDNMLDSKLDIYQDCIDSIKVFLNTLDSSLIDLGKQIRNSLVFCFLFLYYILLACY